MIKSKTYRHVLLLLLTITIAFATQLKSQPKIDTLCPERKDVLKLLTKAQERDLFAKKIELLEEQAYLLGQRIIEKSQMVAAYEQINIENDSLISSYKKEIALLNDEKKILDQAIVDTKKEVRRYKRKLFFRTAGGVLVTGGLAYLYFTK